MSGNRTFTMIKPEAVAAGHAGKILDMIISNGFRVVALKYTRLSHHEAGAFYEVHKERPFYGELVDYMASGPVYAAILEKDNAVEDYRKLVGATDPAQAEEGTIRKTYAKDLQCNSVHGSDAPETAAYEISYFFNALEIV